MTEKERKTIAECLARRHNAIAPLHNKLRKGDGDAESILAKIAEELKGALNEISK